MNLKSIGLALLLNATGSYATTENAWEFDIAPYLWAIQMNGDVQVASHKVTVSESFVDIMKHFKGGGMLWLNAHKNRVGLFANVLYSVLKVNNDVESIAISARNHFGIFSGGVSYVIFENKTIQHINPIVVEVLAGARYTLIDTTINLDRFSVKENVGWTDPIIGMRASYYFNNRWQTILEGDGGGANNHHSYNLQAYLGYTPKKRVIFDHTTFYLGYRLLHQKMQSGYGIRYYQWNMNISGPVLGMKAIF
jgi:hypothetical protein